MVGIGYDVHQLAPGESMILGGVTIESPLGTVAHSDGDVLIHAIMDSILGAIGLGDIGEHFPDNDAKYRNASSIELLKHTISLIPEGYYIVNIDATLILEKPKIKVYKDEMRKNLEAAMGLPYEKINIKATTNEKMGFVGRAEGIAALAVCEIQAKS